MADTNMMAAPSRIHQELGMAIIVQLYNFLEGKLNGCFIELS